MNSKIIILLILVAFTACKPRNRLSSDEQKLTSEIKTEEQEKKEAKSEKTNLSAVPDSLPPGFRFEEDRSVDPEYPPAHIDILGTSGNIKEFKLSDVASSINYIKLETPQDTSLLWTQTKLRDKLLLVTSDDNHILIQGIYGVTRFTMDGKFQEEIWKNESGINAGQNFIFWNPQELFGVTPDNPVSLFNGNLLMRFQDGKKAQVQVINKKIEDDLILNNPYNQQENQLDTLAGDRLFTIQEEYVSRKYPLIYGLGQNCWAGIHDTWNAANNGSLFVIFNNNGDTLCAISAPNQIQNWSKSLVRAGGPFTYYYKNQLTFLEQYGDTIFRFNPPNRLLPVYILDFGKDKVGFYEGLDPDSDLSQKLMLESIFETDNFIFIRYTRNNPGPRNIKNKSVLFYNAVFDKKENKLYHSPGQSLTPEYLKNDIDGGISFWPEFVTPKGDMMMLVTGELLKQYISSNEFTENALTAELQKKHIDMVNELNNNDIIVVVVKK